MKVGSGVSVLVVEDDAFQRRMIVRMLRKLGCFDIKEAGDGREALDSIETNRIPDLVICDLDMPEMDGMELLRHLGEANSTVSVIIASAQEHALLSSVEKMAQAYGVILLGVIEKPVMVDELGTLIARHNQARAQYPAVDQPEQHSLSLNHILHGLRENQFLPYFQPKVDLARGCVRSAEALARWQHPELGMISPAAFIAPLEQSGHIDDLTLLILEKAARACCAWHAKGFDLTVSVNLSLVSLANTMQADRITETVREAGLDPRYMILEITESAAMTDLAHALENLNRLRLRGFGLSVDDYGTGFSSLQQLTRVPFTELKIDQSFVTGCSLNPSSRTIVESSVAMARGLAIKSVAEGVESQEDWDLLKAAGCDLAQGYFIAKPLPQTAFIEFCVSNLAASAGPHPLHSQNGQPGPSSTPVNRP